MHRNRIVALVLVIAVAGVLFLLNRPSESGADTLALASQEYVEKIVAVGQLQMERETTLVAEVSGEILSVDAKEGDLISAGAVILSIDDAGQAFQLEQKKAGYDNADAEYKNLVEIDYVSAKAELVGQTTKKEKAEKSYLAAEKLYQEGALSQIEYLEYKAEYETALATWNASRLKVQALGEGGSLRTSAYSKLESARSSYDGALNDQKKYRITVPWNSVLLKAYVSEHDFVQPGDALADIGEAGSYYVLAELDEKYFPYLSEGMPAAISLGDAEPGKGEVGTVDVISRKINDETGTFDIKIALPEAFPYQASDLTVNVEIILAEKENALLIPGDYLIDGESAVYLYKNGKAVKTKVEYETSPSSKLLITDGLSDGDRIVKPGPQIKDGGTVKPGKGADPS